MRATLAAAVLVVSLSIPMEGKDTCVLDQAQVVAVPPDTFQVMASYFCGGIRCWERTAQIGDQRVALGRVCEKGSEQDTQDRRDLAPVEGS